MRVLKEGLYVVRWDNRSDSDFTVGYSNDPKCRQVLAMNLADALTIVPADAERVEARRYWPAGSVVVAKEATVVAEVTP